jgi:hypothetical protein
MYIPDAERYMGEAYYDVENAIDNVTLVLKPDCEGHNDYIPSNMKMIKEIHDELIKLKQKIQQFTSW